MRLQSYRLLLTAASIVLAAPACPADPVLPTSGLPAPSTLSPTVKLKYVTLGVGHQNYTCDTSGTAVALGATAALFDIKKMLQNNPALGPSISDKALKDSGFGRDSTPASGLGSGSSRAQDEKDYRQSSPISPTQLDFPKSAIGFHYFNSPDKAPVFNFPDYQANLVAAKIANVSAPATQSDGSSNKGPDGASAVDWLLLGDSKQGKSFGGLSHVYRVQTAGGSGAGACAGVATGSVVRVAYAAEYWFYGPDVAVPRTYVVFP